ncbi:uncharacterized protein LOC115443612 [Manduca sexta]|uniref:Uncharacterized protein n=1 Tax=Manduca sexta TaxID=7130 RepID=A0A921Z532_MANSE|nr:uncharacterized protein LOC115443612 [Manduca sexta]KAG6450287.1 hypothetical protein O3G_MSEX006485 [Manduca sexta]
MDHRRRNRRRNHSRSGVPSHPLQHSKPWSLLSGLYSFMIMSSLLALIYLMLEYHCKTCTTKCDLTNITRNIDDISKNLSMMKDSYYDLEKKIFKFSQELPKIEGQIDILEAIANTVENKDLGWNAKIFTLPTVEISSNNRLDDNACNFTARQIRNGLKPIANQE